MLVTSPDGIHARLTAMHRALILHDALVQMIKAVGVEGGAFENKLVSAIQRALDLNLITEREARHCRFFNVEANRAKHDQNLPF